MARLVSASIVPQRNGADSINAGLMGAWLMSEGGGPTVHDWSGRRNDGTIVNYTAAEWVAGRFGKALNFVNASVQSISINDNSALQPARAFTYSAWVKANSFPNAYNCVLHKGDGTNFTECFVKSDGKLAFYQAGPSGSAVYDDSGSFTLSTGVWYHLAFSYDTNAAVGNLHGYVNGQIDATVNGVNDLLWPTPTSVLSIGRDSVTAGRNWDGIITNFRFYNRVLTLAELRRLYAEPMAGLLLPTRRSVGSISLASFVPYQPQFQMAPVMAQ